MGRLLSAYFDGELSGRQTARVEAHLASCAHCRAELARLRETQALIREGFLVSAGDGARELEAMLGAVRKGMAGSVGDGSDRPERAARSWGLRALVPAAVAAAALVLVFRFAVYRTPEPVVKTLVKNDCIVDTIDGGARTVLLFKTHNSKMTVIWISGNGERRSPEEV
jgi:anti-sigma factor RsiW